MKKSIMYTLGLAALFCAACVDNSTNGSGGGEVDALLEKYNNPNGGNGGGGASFMLTTNVNPENGGSVTRNPNSTIYNEGTKVALTAVPKDGYTFKNWTGALNSNNASIEITMDDIKILTANFQKIYESVQIGTQIWMSKNLNDNVEGSRCYDDDPANCVKYGRLYTWDAAKKACNNGWHLPSSAEWDILVNFAGGESVAGKKLKSASGWDGTDQYGFSALPGGYYSSMFNSGGHSGLWWTATENYGGLMFLRCMGCFDEESVGSTYYSKEDLLSVRCVMD